MSGLPEVIGAVITHTHRGRGPPRNSWAAMTWRQLLSGDRLALSYVNLIAATPSTSPCVLIMGKVCTRMDHLRSTQTFFVPTIDNRRRLFFVPIRFSRRRTYWYPFIKIIIISVWVYFQFVGHRFQSTNAPRVAPSPRATPLKKRIL